MKMPKKFNLFLNRGEKGFIWTFTRKDTVYRIFSTPSNGKWKVETNFYEIEGRRFPAKSQVLILGTPKWDLTVSREQFFWYLNAVKRA